VNAPVGSGAGAGSPGIGGGGSQLDHGLPHARQTDTVEDVPRNPAGEILFVKEKHRSIGQGRERGHVRTPSGHASDVGWIAPGPVFLDAVGDLGRVGPDPHPSEVDPAGAVDGDRGVDLLDGRL